MTGSFSQRGGARIGLMNATYPFAALLVDGDMLRLSCLGRQYAFAKDSVELSRYRGLFSVGLRIEHNLSIYPRFIVFWVGSFSDLKRKLEGLEYTVRD
jgi:hypothetical protein